MGNHRSSNAPSVREQLLRASDRVITPTSFSVAMICVTVFALVIIAGCVIGPRYGYDVESILDTTWKVPSTLGGFAVAFYLRGQRQQLSRVEVGVNKPSE